jgi:starch synthase
MFDRIFQALFSYSPFVFSQGEFRFDLTPASGAATLLVGVVSRLTWQKGLDLLLAETATLQRLDMQLALLVSGERDLEDGFAAAARSDPGRIACVIGHDEALAHLIQAGADALLVPSRFEPCGLTQLCALRYGALPVVARVGGLADTVVDANEAALAAGAGTGLQFSPVTRDALAAALRRLAALWRDPDAWRVVQRNAMTTDVSWRRPAQRYAALYRALHAERTA